MDIEGLGKLRRQVSIDESNHSRETKTISWDQLVQRFISPLKSREVSSNPPLQWLIANIVSFLSLIVLLYGVVLLIRLAGLNVLNEGVSTSSSVVQRLFGIAFFIFIVFLFFGTYGYQFIFFSSRHYSWFYKVVFVLLSFFSLGIVVFLPSINTGAANILYHRVPLNQLLYLYFQDYEKLFQTLHIIFVYLIPSITLLVFFHIDLFIWITWGVVVTLSFPIYFHKPISLEKIRKLVTARIPSRKKTGQTWTLMELDLNELDSIRHWAEANRESTEKRILPATILLSALQFIGWSAIASYLSKEKLLDLGLAVTRDIFFLLFSFTLPSSYNILYLAFGILVVNILFISTMSVIALFGNLLPQSIIIEACVVARFAKVSEVKAIKETKAKSRRKGLWEMIKSLLFRT